MKLMKILFLLTLLLSSLAGYSQTPEENIKKMGIQLPEINAPVGSYVHCVRVGNLIFFAGKGPQQDGEYISGKLGKELPVEEGYAAAKLTATIQLAVLKNEIGELSKVKRIVKVNGYVNSEPDFTEHPKVTNGFSDLLIQVFGEKGKHARTSVGVNSLPFNMVVEFEMVVEVED